METSLSLLGRLTDAPSDADWRRLLDVYGPLLRDWLGRAGVPASDRDDLVQDVLVVVVRRIAEFERRGPGAFRAWLRGILANHLRKYFRTRTAPAALDLDKLACEDSVLSRQWDREHDQFLADRALRMAEQDFAPATWQAFRRQVLEGQKPAVVAAELGLSLNSVLLAKCRVLKRLREVLAGLVE